MTPPEPLLIVGAGGFARETARAVADINRVAPRWDLLGHLDDDPATHGTKVGGLPVLGPVDSLADHPHARVVVCTGSPRAWWSRHQIVVRLGLEPSRYATIVHPTVSLADDTVVGIGSVLLAAVVATSNVRVGDHVAAMPGVVLTHDDDIGDHVTLGSGVHLGGGATLAHGAYVGAGALVREGLTIGAWSLVGMGSVVLHDVPTAEIWVGSPARHLRMASVPAAVIESVPSGADHNRRLVPPGAPR